MKKKRLDHILVDKGWATTRSRAQAMVKFGNIRVQGEVCTDSGIKLSESAVIELIEPDHSFVSRGGLKLAGALEDFSISVKGKTALDIGASTGGFTDCLLQNGAKFVYAVDIGSGQLAEKLRNHPQVKFWENAPIQEFPAEEIKSEIEIVTIDVSFISLEKILPHVKRFLLKNGELLALIKPQFEAGKSALTKSGNLKDPAMLEQIFNKVKTSCEESGFQVQNIQPSRYKGTDGNQEYFLHAQKK